MITRSFKNLQNVSNYQFIPNFSCKRINKMINIFKYYNVYLSLKKCLEAIKSLHKNLIPWLPLKSRFNQYSYSGKWSHGQNSRSNCWSY